MKFVLAFVVSALTFGTVLAADETMNFQLNTRKISDGNFAGVAIFKDGRIADKQFTVEVIENAGASGKWIGDSTYTFVSGDSLTLKFAGGWGKDGSYGDYTVISGTGAYSGATGKSRFASKKDSWRDANLYDVNLQIKGGGD